MPVTQDGYREVLLDGVPVPMRTVLPETDLRTFPGKVTIGDYTEDSHPLLSTWVISDLSGGHGVEDMNEGSDINRYRFGTLYTRFPRQISRPYSWTDVISDDLDWDPVFQGTDPRFLGDFLVSGTWKGIVAAGNVLYTIDDPSTVRGTLTTDPVNNGVMFRGTAASDSFVIPRGSGGISRLSTAYSLTNTAASGTCPAAVSLLVWDNKLLALDTEGQIWYTTDVTGTWTPYGPTAKLPSGSVPRRLVPYFDRQGLPTPFVVTDTDIWQFDAAQPAIFTVDVWFPPHPQHGLAACRWSGDLYFSVGPGVHRYTGGSLSAMGLDRDHGLPFDYVGYIVAGGLVPGYNAIYAFVQGYGTPGPDRINGSIHEWTGTGWHVLTTVDGGYDLISNSMAISRHDDNYRLYYGFREWPGDASDYASLKYLDLPIGFANPRQAYLNPVRPAQFGNDPTFNYLETSIFDAAMKGYKKIANGLDLSISHAPASGTITVKYKIDGAADWTTLGNTVQGATGTYTFMFGASSPVDTGIVFERIQFRFEMTESFPYTFGPFIMESAVLSFIKTMPGSLAWTAEINLGNEHKGLSPAQLRSHIKGILDNRAFVPMVKNGTTYRVYLSQIKGASETGFDERGTMTVSILQIPDGMGA